jgi:hypothetical protein
MAGKAGLRIAYSNQKTVFAWGRFLLTVKNDNFCHFSGAEKFGDVSRLLCLELRSLHIGPGFRKVTCSLDKMLKKGPILGSHLIFVSVKHRLDTQNTRTI